MLFRRPSNWDYGVATEILRVAAPPVPLILPHCPCNGMSAARVGAAGSPRDLGRGFILRALDGAATDTLRFL